MIFCKNCSRLLEEEADVCPHCGAEDENAEAVNNLIINDKPAENDNRPRDNAGERVIIEDRRTGGDNDDPEIPASARTLWILLSVFIAPAGIIAGIYNMSRDSKNKRALGRTMLIVSLVSAVLSVVCCCGFYMIIVNNFILDGFY